MNLLVLETSAEPCSVAIYSRGNLQIKMEVDAEQRSRNILVMLASLLEEANLLPSQLDGIVWSAGPGSFTGLRMGASVCQAIAFVHQLPILSLSSLKMHAQSVVGLSDASEGSHIAVAIDARMGEIYLASFVCKGGQLQYLCEDQLVPANPEAILARLDEGNSWLLAGDGWEAAGMGIGQNRWFDTAGTLVSSLVSLAVQAPAQEWCKNPEDCTPRYLRGATQWKKRQRIRT